jgi:hypothetical protein
MRFGDQALFNSYMVHVQNPQLTTWHYVYMETSFLKTEDDYPSTFIVYGKLQRH